MTAGRFEPDELARSEGASPPDAELAQATRIGRELERRRGTPDVRPSADFADRVMAAVFSEPPPVATEHRFRRWGPALALASLRDAWRVAVSGPGRPIGVRAGALAYVLVAVIGLSALGGAAAIGVAGALGVFDASPSPAPSLPAPSALPSPSMPDGTASPSVAPSPSVEASQDASEGPTSSGQRTEEPSNSAGSPGASPAGSPAANPSDEPEGSDDHGGGSSPSPSATETPKPSGSNDSG